MPTKKGAGGRLQNYDSHGRYAKMSSFDYYDLKLTKKEKAMMREKNKRDELFNKAKKKNDPLVLDVFLEIERSFPGIVQAVNSIVTDVENGKKRELDIVTKSHIIEVKSGKARHSLTQFKAQKLLAAAKKREYLVYAPSIASGAEKSYLNQDIRIVKTIDELKRIIKESKK